MTIVHGVELDHESRCTHYNSSRDVVAIKFYCCQKWYACIHCHDACEDHEASQWPTDEFESAAILCGVCKAALNIQTYLTQPDSCGECSHAFNPGCKSHHALYFEIP